MPELQVKVVTTAQGQGAQQAASDLANLKSKVEQLPPHFEDLARKTDKAEKSKSSLVLALKKLSGELPIVGAAVSALLNPFTALTIAAGYAIAKFREFSAEVNASAERMRAFESVNLVIKNFDRIVAETRAGRKQFAEELDLIARKGRTVAEMMSGLSERESRKINLEGKVAGKQTEMSKAAIETLMQSGFLPRQAGQEMLRQIQATAGAGEREREERAIASRVNVTSQQIFRTRDEVREAQAALPGAEAAEEAARKEVEQKQHFAEVHLAETRRRIAQLRGTPEAPGLISKAEGAIGGPGSINFNVRTAEAAALKRELEQRLTEESRLTAIPTDAITRQKIAADAVQRLRGTISSGQESIRTLSGQKSEQQQELEDVRGANRQLGEMEGTMLGVRLPSTRPVSAAENDARTGRVRQASARQAATDLEKTLSATLSDVVTMLQRLTGEMREVRSQIKRNETL